MGGRQRGPPGGHCGHQGPEQGYKGGTKKVIQTHSDQRAPKEVGGPGSWVLHL